MSEIPSCALRARLARGLSHLYGKEVPAYTTLVDVSREVNAIVLRERGSSAERFGDIARVTEERHGAIRVGTVEELKQVARIFGAVGMYPTGFYDLREAKPTPIPVVSTAFRPIDGDELAINPFRVFTSLLVPEDRRFFDADLEQRLKNFLGRRQLFSDELLALADKAEANQGLPAGEAERFVELATSSLALSEEPVDRSWYATLEQVSSVAADIGGVTGTHINHLTPRVLDIDLLYERMQARGVEMIDRIQGPPRWSGPDVLLRQTSFRALSEPRTFREPDGTLSRGALRVRFGEVEARGMALTAAGRDLYDALLAEVDRCQAAAPDVPRQEIAEAVWWDRMPRTEYELIARDLAYFTYTVAPDRPTDGRRPPRDLTSLVSEGWLVAAPVVYEDFLPRSAAGIFSSNLTGDGSVDAAQLAAVRDMAWLAGALDRPVHDPIHLYDRQRGDSLRHAADALRLPSIQLPA